MGLGRDDLCADAGVFQRVAQRLLGRRASCYPDLSAGKFIEFLRTIGAHYQAGAVEESRNREVDQLASGQGDARRFAEKVGFFLCYRIEPVAAVTGT